MKAGRLVAVAATAAACSSGGAGALAPPTADERSGLQALRELVPGPSVSSDIFAYGRAQAVAIAVMRQRSNPAVPRVDIYEWERNSWHTAATINLDVGGSVAADDGTTTPIRTADVTPAATSDLVVTVHYNAGPASAILSTYGGRWHALQFHGGLADDGDERFDLAVQPGGIVTSRENDCVPNCADGHEVTTSYHFSKATGRLEEVSGR